MAFGCGAGTDCHAVIDQLPLLLQGYKTTLELVGAAAVPSIVIALVLALGRISRHRWCRLISTAHIELFRGLPALILLVLLYYGLGRQLQDLHITAFWTAWAALTINESAYAAGPYVACLLSVGIRQWDAVASLGFRRFAALRYVIVPQALLTSLAPTANLLIFLAKGSALASLITVNEVILASQDAISNTYAVLPMYIAVAVLYLVLTVPLTYVTKFVESRVHKATGARGLV